MTQVDWPATRNRASWLERLGEAALLPTCDARRQAVEAEVARRGGWIRDEWLALIAEEEGLRLALHRARPPEDLSERLLALPDRAWPLRLLPRRSAPLLAVAALALLALGAFWFFNAQSDARSEAHVAVALQEVALLSISDHLDTHAVEIEAENAALLSNRLSAVVPFEVSLPDLSPAFELVGGRRCTLGSHPVAFSSWRSARGALTVLQLRSEDFDLPRTLSLRDVIPTGAAARTHNGGGAVLHGRDGFLWVCVADHPADLARARTELQRLGVQSE